MQFSCCEVRLGIGPGGQNLFRSRVAAFMDALGAPVAILVPIFGMTTLGSLVFEWMPLFLCATVPFLCIPFVLAGFCSDSGRDNSGSVRRAMRGLMIAVRADIRMGKDTNHTKLLAAAGFKNTKNAPSFMKPTSNRLESGLAYSNARKSPDQGKAKAEEKAMKTGKSRFY